MLDKLGLQVFWDQLESLVSLEQQVNQDRAVKLALMVSQEP